MRQHGIVQMTFILYIMNRNYFSLVPISLKDALLNLHDIMYNLNVSSHGHLRPTNREILRVQLCIANVFYVWLHTIAQRYDGGSESSCKLSYFVCDNKMFNREKSLITQGWVKIRKKGWGSTTDHNDQNIMYINELVSNLQFTTKEIGLPIPLLSCQVWTWIKVIVYLSLYTHLSMKYNWYRSYTYSLKCHLF